MKLSFQFFLGLIIGLIIGTFSFVLADSNGIWYDAQDVRGGVFGSDEQNVSSFYTFMNPVDFQDNVYFLDWVGIMTKNPSVELEVNGTIKTNKLLADNLRNKKCGLHQAIVGFNDSGDIICETIYEYFWKYDGWGTCQGVCETTGNKFRTVWCEREDGIVVDNEFCVNGANTTQPDPSQSCWTGSCNLYASTFTPLDCSVAGGTVVTVTEGDICRFDSKSCPTGWSNYNNWRTTKSSGICPSLFDQSSTYGYNTIFLIPSSGGNALVTANYGTAFCDASYSSKIDTYTTSGVAWSSQIPQTKSWTQNYNSCGPACGTEHCKIKTLSCKSITTQIGCN